MNPAVKKMWVDALRSGQYKQGTDALYTPETNSYCCLGVLCDLYKKQIGSTSSITALSDDGEGAHPGQLVQNWAGLTRKNPRLQYNDRFTPVADLNDGTFLFSDKPSKQLSFAEIADLIEEQL